MKIVKRKEKIEWK